MLRKHTATARRIPCRPSSSSTPMARCSTCMPRLRAFARRRRARRRPHVGNLAQQAARIYLDADAGRPLYADFWTLTERALDFHWRACRPCPRRSNRNCSTPISSSTPFPTRARPCARSKPAGKDRHSVQRLAEYAERRGRRRRHRRRSRCRAVGGRAEDVQAAAGGLRPGHRSLQMRAERRDLRLVQPLGRDGGNFRRLPRAVGQPRQDAGRISRFPAEAGAERSRRIGDL